MATNEATRRTLALNVIAGPAAGIVHAVWKALRRARRIACRPIRPSRIDEFLAMRGASSGMSIRREQVHEMTPEGCSTERRAAMTRARPINS